VERGVLTEPEIQDRIAYMDSRSPENGARLVARAWVDPEFKERLLSDTKAAAKELGIDASGPVEFVVVENTPEVHNLIVCTLCSCYPRAILGRPPDWYKSFEYRSRAVREPRLVMREFGFEPPEGVEVAVHDSTADVRYMVLPMRPPGTEGLGEEELAELVTRDALIGVSVPRYAAE
jgi:nitrile hydratase